MQGPRTLAVFGLRTGFPKRIDWVHACRDHPQMRDVWTPSLHTLNPKPETLLIKHLIPLNPRYNPNSPKP